MIKRIVFIFLLFCSCKEDKLSMNNATIIPKPVSVIIKDGFLIKEHYSFMTLPGSRFDVWSCTKSFTGLAWLLLLEEIKKGISSLFGYKELMLV